MLAALHVMLEMITSTCHVQRMKVGPQRDRLLFEERQKERVKELFAQKMSQLDDDDG
jgi:hypothetical protein